VEADATAKQPGDWLPTQFAPRWRRAVSVPHAVRHLSNEEIHEDGSATHLDCRLDRCVGDLSWPPQLLGSRYEQGTNFRGGFRRQGRLPGRNEDGSCRGEGLVRDGRLRRLQQRMYGCIDAAIDGQLTDQFPETKGKKIIVSVDFYEAPQEEASEFFDRLSKHVFLIPSYSAALMQSRFVNEIAFEANLETPPE
jgi:hypothetical protein